MAWITRAVCFGSAVAPHVNRPGSLARRGYLFSTMVGYHIRPGYNGNGPAPEKIIAALREIFERIRSNPSLIREELLRVESPGVPEADLQEYIDDYRDPASATMKIVEEDGVFEVFQVASGVGESRAVKEMCRRAVCRIFLTEMSRRGVNISIVVA